MPKHHEIKQLPYSPDQLFQLVIDIDKYPDFLPWCVAARVNSKTDSAIHADLAIGYQVIREKFSSYVTFKRPAEVAVEYKNGPFKYLQNVWKFRPIEIGGKEGTQVEFFVDFEFKSSLLQVAIQAVFEKAVRKMVMSFEQRAKDLYA